jgi:hypothetical protein
MHLTLKKEATKPATANFLQQQARFGKFIDVLQQPTASRSAKHEVPGELKEPIMYTRLLAVSGDRYAQIQQSQHNIKGRPLWSRF